MTFLVFLYFLSLVLHIIIGTFDSALIHNVLLSYVIVFASYYGIRDRRKWRYVLPGDIAARAYEWPTVALQKMIKRLTLDTESPINPPLATGLRDVTESAKEQLLEFMPLLKMTGPDLYLEQRFPGRWGTWGGVFFRALEEPNREFRCLQYLYVYTRQLSVVGPVWWVLTPLLIASWQSSVQGLPSWVFVVIFSPLFLVTIWSHRQDPTGQFRPQSATVLGFFWAFEWAGLWWPEMPRILLTGAALFFAAVYIADRFEILPTGHRMDYIPVFVWLQRIAEETSNSPEEWIFHSAAWDVYHYEAKHMTRKELEDLAEQKERELETFLYEEKGIRLLMDNQWHSVRLGSGEVRRQGLFNWSSWVVVLLIPIVYGGSWSTILTTDYWWFSFILYPFIVVVALCYLVLGPYDVASRWSLYQEYLSAGAALGERMDSNIWNHLEKRFCALGKALETFWNLQQTGRDTNRHRLVVVLKLQDPFRFISKPFTTFRDE